MSLLCTRCKQEKPEGEFREAWRLKKKSGKRAPRKDDKRGGKFSWCRACCSEAAKDYVAKKDPAEHKEAKRATHYRTTYGITLGEYDKMVEAQDGGCWICGSRGKTRGLNLDHNHKTGLVRGLLCPQCNRGLRWFRDNPGDLRRAAVDIGSSAVIAISNQISNLDQTREVLDLYMCALLEDRTNQIITNARVGAAETYRVN